MTKKKYITYSDEWERDLMKQSKKQLVDIIRRVCKERDSLKEDIKDLEDRRDELIMESGRGNLKTGRL